MNWPDLHLPQLHLPQLDLAQVPDWVWPPLCGLFTAWLGWTSYQQYLKGEATLPRIGQTFYRSAQPRLFWFATGLSAFYVLLLAFISTVLAQDVIQKRIMDECAPSSSGSQAYYRILAKSCEAPLHSIWASPSTLNLLHDNRGFALQRIGADGSAIDEFTRAIAINPKDEWAFYTRGRSYERLGTVKNALSDFDTAVKLAPNDSDALRSRAFLNLAVGQASKAIADLNRLAVKDAWALHMLALAYAMKDQCDTALQFADKALLLGDKSIWPYQVKGECFGKAKHFDDALSAYDGATLRDPKDPRPYLDRANINFRNEKYSDAIEDLSRGLKVIPDNFSLLYQRCYFRALSDRQPEGAVIDCNNLLKSFPHSLEVLEARVMAIYRTKQYAMAEQNSTEILQQFPNSSTALYIRGLARKRLGSPLGESDIASAQDKNASDVSSLIGLGFKP